MAAERGSGQKDRPKKEEFKQKFWENLGTAKWSNEGGRRGSRKAIHGSLGNGIKVVVFGRVEFGANGAMETITLRKKMSEKENPRGKKYGASFSDGKIDIAK